MFDLGWSEMLIIAVVAIIVVGPKDLPAMLRQIGRFVGQARRMAAEFTGQFQEAIKDSELDDLKKEFNEVSKTNPLSDFEKSINKDLDELDRDLQETVSDYDRADEAENAAFKNIVPPPPFPNNAPSYRAPSDEAANENDATPETDDNTDSDTATRDADEEATSDARPAVKAAGRDEVGT